MNKKEAIEKVKSMTVETLLSRTLFVKQTEVIAVIEQIDEPTSGHVVIPQFVADWIEYCKINKISLGHALYRSEEAKDKRVYRWLVESLDNQDLFALAWIFGY